MVRKRLAGPFADASLIEVSAGADGLGIGKVRARQGGGGNLTRD